MNSMKSMEVLKRVTEFCLSMRFTRVSEKQTNLHTALGIGDDLFVINSFQSFGMTGWRLGWGKKSVP